MSYAAKEIFYTLQGEGANTGRTAVFCRFAGCNLWSGLEQDRARPFAISATPILSARTGRAAATLRRPTPWLTPWRLAGRIAKPVSGRWSFARAASPCCRWIKPWSTPCTHAASRLPSRPTAHGCPRAASIGFASAPRPASNACCAGHELKVIFPQPGAEPELFESWDFRHFVLQPMDGVERERNTRLAVEYCLKHPRWRLSLQTQKLLGIP